MSLQEWYSVTNLASVGILTYLSGMVCHRIWRMVARDSIFDKPRQALYDHPRTPQWVEDLIDCPWCLGWWLNVAFAAFMYVAADISFPSALIVALAGSTLTGALGRGD
jgi:hypothetical protein